MEDTATYLTRKINERIMLNAEQMLADAKEPNQNTWTYRNLKSHAKETYELTRLLNEMDEFPSESLAWAIRRFNKVTNSNLVWRLAYNEN